MEPGCTDGLGALAGARLHRQTSVPLKRHLHLPYTAPACWLCRPHMWQCTCSRGYIPSEALCIWCPCVQKKRPEKTDMALIGCCMNKSLRCYQAFLCPVSSHHDEHMVGDDKKANELCVLAKWDMLGNLAGMLFVEHVSTLQRVL